MEKFKGLVKDIIALMNEMEKDLFDNIEKGNKAAGKRARVKSVKLGKMLKDFRKLSVEVSKNGSK